LNFGAHGGENGFATKTGFFLGGDNFEDDAGGLFDAANELFAILSFTSGGGSNGAIFGYAVLLHDLVEMAKGFDTLLDEVFAESMTDEDAFPKAKWVTFGDERFDVETRIGASDG